MSTSPQELVRRGSARRALDLNPPAVVRAEALRLLGRLDDVAAALVDLPEATAAPLRARLALDRGEEVTPDPTLPLLVQASVLLAHHPAAARAVATQALREARATQDLAAEDDSLTLVARAMVELRDYARARPLLLEALRRHEQAGCRPGMVDCLGALGLVSLGLAETSRGAQRLTQAVQLAADLEAPVLEAQWRVHLDHALVLLERMEWRARELRRFIEVVHPLGRVRWEAELWCELGNTLRSVRDFHGALEAHRQALALSRQLGEAHAISVDLSNLGRVHLDLRAWREARLLLEEAVRLGSPDAPHVVAARVVLDGWIYGDDDTFTGEDTAGPAKNRG